MSEKTFKVRLKKNMPAVELTTLDDIQVENEDDNFYALRHPFNFGIFYILKTLCTILPDEQPQKRRIDLSETFRSIAFDEPIDHIAKNMIEKAANRQHDEIIADKDREIEELKKRIFDYSTSCECGDGSIGQTWCCNVCGKPYRRNAEVKTDAPKLPEKIGTLNFADSDSMVMRNKINEIIDYMKTKGL